MTSLFGVYDHIEPLHKWSLNLNNNTLYLLSLVLMSFHMNVRLRMYKYCYSNLSAIYAKGLFMCMNVYPFSALSPVCSLYPARK